MVRVGIIGCGKNGRGHFMRLRKIPEAKVTALYDVNAEAPKAWLAELEANETRPRITGDLDEMWEHVDAVWVTSPPGFHYQHAAAALRAGKHVMCEKPIALELPHADEMLGIAAEKKLKFMVGYCLRFQPAFSAFAEIAAGGKIGELSSLWCTRIANRLEAPPSWRDDIAMCGGMLIETFTHNIDWMRLVAGEVKEVYMKERTIHPRINFEDHAVGVIEFQNGAIGEFFSSWASPKNRYDWGVVGNKGAATRLDESRIEIAYASGEKEIVTVEKTDQTLLEDTHFIRAVAYDEPLLFDAADSTKTLEVHVALKLSARDGMPVTLPLADRSPGIPSFAVPGRRTA